MRRLLLIISLCMLLTGCNNTDSVSTSNVNKVTEDIHVVRDDIKYELPETEEYVYDEDKQFVKYIIGDVFEIRNSLDCCYTYLEGSNTDDEYTLSLSDLDGFNNKGVDHVYTCKYEFRIADSGSIEWFEHPYLLEKGYTDINDKSWFYYIQDYESSKEVYMVYSDENSNKDLIMRTMFYTNDIDLIKNNINVLLKEIDLNVVS